MPNYQEVDNVTTKFTHHTRADGNETYGSSYVSFPRRNLVGGYYVTDQSWLGQNKIFYPGSRSLMAWHSTGLLYYFTSNI